MLVGLAISLGQRERKLINGNLEERSKMKEYKKPKQLTGWKAKAGGGFYHQFYDQTTLDYLDEKEKEWKDHVKLKEEGELNEDVDVPEEFTANDEKLRCKLLKEGFSKWTKKDFAKFLRASEVYGLNDPENIARLMKSKTPDEVEEYSKVFKDRINELPNGERLLSRINKFESEKNKITEYQTILEELLNELSDTYEDVFNNIKIPYKTKAKPTVEL